MRCRAGAATERRVWCGPGSAKQREERCIAPGTRYPKRKKGRLRMASGPSLGRKRPRRAAIARGATAPQQYATALHKVQGVSSHFRCKIRRRQTNRDTEISLRNSNIYLK